MDYKKILNLDECIDMCNKIQYMDDKTFEYKEQHKLLGQWLQELKELRGEKCYLK